MSKTQNLRINLMIRNATKNGPAQSDLINDTIDEISTDLLNIQSQWNNSLIPLLNTIPSGSVNDGTDTVDAFTNGLDGSTLYIDADITAAGTNIAYYNAAQNRPNTIKEQCAALYLYSDAVREELTTEITTLTGILSQTVKERIGINVFDSTAISSASSVDGRTNTNSNNITQLARDLYGIGFSLDGDGNANLAIPAMTVLDNVRQYTGMTNLSDVSPTYTSNNVVTDGDSLEVAIGKIDTEINALPAANVIVTDTGGYFVATNVEAVLAEIADGFAFQGAISSTTTITSTGNMTCGNDLSVGQDLTVTRDCDIGRYLSVANASDFHVGLRFDTDDSFQVAIALATKSLELIAGNTSGGGIYGCGIKFMSDDSSFITEKPKLIAGIFPRATEDYASDFDGGAAIDFFATHDNPGTNNVPDLVASMFCCATAVPCMSIGYTRQLIKRELEVVRVGSNHDGIGLALFNDGGIANTGARFDFMRSHHGSTGHTIVQDNDELGKIRFLADDGVDYDSIGAEIFARVNGTPGAGDMPTELVFATTADGAEVATEHMYINCEGKVGIGVSSPQDILHVNSGAADSTIRITNSASGDTNTDGLTVGISTADAYIRNYENGPIIFYTNNVEVMRLDTSGFLGLGCDASHMLELQKVGSGSSAPQICATGFTDDANGGAYINLCKSRGATVGTYAATSNGDTLGIIDFRGVNSSAALATSVRLIVHQDGAVGADYVPGRFMIYTGTNGAAATERFRIDSDGDMDLKGVSVAHGLTSVADTNSYAKFEYMDWIKGGLKINAIDNRTDNESTALQLNGYTRQDPTGNWEAHTTAGRGIVEVYAAIHDGSDGLVDLDADDNAFVVRRRTGGGDAAAFIVKGDGDIYYDGADQGAFDNEQDALACKDLAYYLSNDLGKILSYNRDKLEKLGVCSGTMVSSKKMAGLQLGAIGELYLVIDYLLKENGRSYEEIRELVRKN